MGDGGVTTGDRRFAEYLMHSHYYKNEFAQRHQNSLRGGHNFCPLRLMAMIYRGGPFLFTEADVFVRHGKSIYRGGHIIRSATVNSGPAGSPSRPNIRSLYIYQKLGFYSSPFTQSVVALPIPSTVSPCSSAPSPQPPPHASFDSIRPAGSGSDPCCAVLLQHVLPIFLQIFGYCFDRFSWRFGLGLDGSR